MEAETMEDVFGPVISSYSRAQAIDDGFLVDVSEPARECGFTYPVALTRPAWERAVALKRNYKGVQDEAGRLWDVLWMLYVAIKRRREQGDELLYRVKISGRFVTLKSVCGPGDDAEPVITIMLPDED